MKEKILRMLKETEGYVSGQEICELLGVSRTAVWKNINQLKEEGYEIEAVQNRGYILKQTADSLSEFEIKSEINGCEWFAGDIYFYHEIGSTNDECKKLAEEGAKHGTLVVAEKQTKGKGRRGRSWESPKGTGIWMTLLLRPDIEPYNSSGLTLVTAMAINKAVQEITGLDAKIKWPNDIVVNGKKVTGILTEMSAQPEMINYIVIGIGINVNTEEFPEDIAKTASSLKIESGKTIKRSSIIALFGKYFEQYYAKYIKTQDMSLLIDEYNKELINVDRQIKVLAKENSYTGIAKGINRHGELIVETENKELKNVVAGEVSVRGLYGYV
ncbi:biotin--[acetyl-CoA-carboxylase] ligase [Falcatimonas sp. MSJ-15]|uniref:biotin--[acetyl-CoA-carboxylase] ligase n=1 Tax=Falcatimonas sp. MSJ-15 TaxID=2841515 RepID=UPI001C0FA77D|nr:biotin--[acetyl-CoA-carboxylase] ligase [Falcatimonas sp. MSJ-15]MBU5470021.1 biotin--[acetyl-CoA-carboxylase] ligase [Falcatimonas sp. MSJ-15]